jgi:UDP-N-acetylmuramoylalanine--D-glutamate ligase
MDRVIRETMEGRNVLLLGFGREGQSTYRLIRKILPLQQITIADANESVRDHEILKTDGNLSFLLGKDYLQSLDRFDVVVKSPGITLKDISYPLAMTIITSQTDLFLRRYSGQVIGVTGTKGKSTAASLVYHILDNAGKETVLLGNIGTPAFHFIERLKPETRIVFELSSHQLEHIICSPHIAILLNLYQEHLDAYRSFGDYQLAKMNIAKYQQKGDSFIYNADDPLILGHIENIRGAQELVPVRLSGRDGFHFHNRYLRGDHNVRNVLAAMSACRLAGLDDTEISEGIDSFKGLAHRMEYVGRFHGIDFYDDSIATIPEACMAAVRAIPAVDTLLLGGFDRGVDYEGFARFLVTSEVQTFIVTGMAGARIAEAMEKAGLQGKRLIRIHRFDEFLRHAIKYTTSGHVCLLSPAAASYDEFRSFEERGMRFAELVRTVTG